MRSGAPSSSEDRKSRDEDAFGCGIRVITSVTAVL